MKIVALPIECIAWFNKEGIPTPIKFRILNNSSNKAVKVNQIVHREKEKLAGNHMYVFDCQSDIGGGVKRYQLKYALDTCKWMLFKM
ncbi:hypothetical protein [Wukongibacter baidiensis]